MIPEESLRQAAQRAQEALLDSLPETPAAHTFSPAYRRKLARLARRMDRKPRPPHWVLHRVAGILLAAVCLGGVVLGTNAQAREAVFGWVRQWMEGDLWYRYQGDAVQNRVLTPYQITVPEGYQLDKDVWGDTFQDEEGGYVREHYVNAAGEEIYFTYAYGTDRWKDMTFAVEDQMERKPLQIHGNPAELSLPTEPEGRSVILWVDNTTGALLEVAAPLEEAELIALAESAAPVESYFS